MWLEEEATSSGDGVHGRRPIEAATAGDVIKGRQWKTFDGVEGLGIEEAEWRASDGMGMERTTLDREENPFELEVRTTRDWEEADPYHFAAAAFSRTPVVGAPC